MKDPVSIIDAIITNLDRLTVQGVRNMSFIIDSINALGELRDALTREGKSDVQNHPE